MPAAPFLSLVRIAGIFITEGTEKAQITKTLPRINTDNIIRKRSKTFEMQREMEELEACDSPTSRARSAK